MELTLYQKRLRTRQGTYPEFEVVKFAKSGGMNTYHLFGIKRTYSDKISDYPTSPNVIRFLARDILTLTSSSARKIKILTPAIRVIEINSRKNARRATTPNENDFVSNLVGKPLSPKEMDDLANELNRVLSG